MEAEGIDRQGFAVNMEQPLRAIGKKTNLLPAAEIPRLGFGSTEITRRTSVGLVTEVVPRAFRLSCGCVVGKHEECGAPCFACRAELEEIAIASENGNGLLANSDQLDWLATPCLRHSQTCSYSFCGNAGCIRHIAVGVDGKPYCLAHFQLVEQELTFHGIKEKHGSIASGLCRLISSLFFP